MFLKPRKRVRKIPLQGVKRPGKAKEAKPAGVWITKGGRMVFVEAKSPA